MGVLYPRFQPVFICAARHVTQCYTELKGTPYLE